MSHHASHRQTSCSTNIFIIRSNKLATSSAQFMSEFNNPNLEVLLTEQQIQERIKELGAQITRDYAGLNPLLIDVPSEGRHILVVEDIVDTGLTLSYLLANLASRGAKSVKLAALLDKYERRQKEVKIDYLGFQIPDEFVVGYGLDFAERYRNLPFIAVLKNPDA